MHVCPKCGAENLERARFCLDCGTALTAPTDRPLGGRKMVTILFADVVGSTALGEQLDPETTRAVLARYFAAARRIVESHGGTIEKFIGDAVMAVFGIPQLHEDDALRAVRAALELREAIAELNARLLTERGLRIDFRIGVNSGEVVAGGDEGSGTLVTGDAVNVAARLEQAAAPMEILIGEETLRLVRDAAQVEPAPAISAKGKARPVPAYRLLGVTGRDQEAERGQYPFVGRQREMARLKQAFEDAGLERRCYLFTLLGTAGVGKSRLVSEFTGHAGETARVVHGRCLPYGEGITYWPIAEIVRVVVGAQEHDHPDELTNRLARVVDQEPDGARVAQLVARAIGLSSQPAGAEETFWAVRRFLESQAREGPLVCVIEDIHWAEPTLLDLLEHVAEWTRDAPILLLCTARPELLEVRPTWGGGKVNAATLLLEPLSADQTRELVASLLYDHALPAGVVGRILETAEGNPLFAEEIVRMLMDQDIAPSDGPESAGLAERMAMPTSVQAVIAARLDRLPTSERMVAERASVAGRVFERGAVLALVSEAERETVAADLNALVRKELVHPDRAELTTDDAFRFRHLLIRDTAYEALPKEERAKLHERFAAWVEDVVSDRVGEYGEIIGYHYEQAHRYRRELGLDDDQAAHLAERGATQLAAAGKRAYRRGDQLAAVKLLGRAITLLPPGEARLQARVDLVQANLSMKDHHAAGTAVAALQADAQDLDARPYIWKARLLDTSNRFWSDPTIDASAAAQIADEAEALFTDLGDAHGMALVQAIRIDFYVARAEWAAVVAEAERGLTYAAAADPVLEDAFRREIVAASLWGPRPVLEMLSVAEQTMPLIHADRPDMLQIVALGRALAGQVDQARADASEALRMRVEMVGPERAALFTPAWVEYVLGDLEAAEALVRRTNRAFELVGETGARSTMVALLAMVLYEKGRADAEVVPVIEECRALTADDDVVSHVLWREVQALVDARAGRHDQARELLAEALAIAEPSDFLYTKGLLWRDLGRIEELAGIREAAHAAYLRSLEFFEQKGDVVDAQRMREAVARLS